MKIIKVTFSFLLGIILICSISNASSSINVDFIPIKFIINGVERTPHAELQGLIYDGKVYVTLRFISETFGHQVAWDDNNHTVYLTTSFDTKKSIVSGLSQIIVPIISLVAVLISFFSVRNSYKQSRTSTIFQCNSTYVHVMKIRDEAYSEKSIDKYRQYCREYYDLQWIQYNFWKQGLLLESVYKEWLFVRAKVYDYDKITIEEDGKSKELFCKQVWAELVSSNYFGESLEFVNFMQLVHRNKVDQAFKFKRFSKLKSNFFESNY